MLELTTKYTITNIWWQLYVKYFFFFLRNGRFNLIYLMFKYTGLNQHFNYFEYYRLYFPIITTTYIKTLFLSSTMRRLVKKYTVNNSLTKQPRDINLQKLFGESYLMVFNYFKFIRSNKDIKIETLKEFFKKKIKNKFFYRKFKAVSILRRSVVSKERFNYQYLNLINTLFKSTNKRKKINKKLIFIRYHALRCAKYIRFGRRDKYQYKDSQKRVKQSLYKIVKRLKHYFWQKRQAKKLFQKLKIRGFQKRYYRYNLFINVNSAKRIKFKRIITFYFTFLVKLDINKYFNTIEIIFKKFKDKVFKRRRQMGMIRKTYYHMYKSLKKTKKFLKKKSINFTRFFKYATTSRIRCINFIETFYDKQKRSSLPTFTLYQRTFNSERLIKRKLYNFFYKSNKYKINEKLMKGVLTFNFFKYTEEEKLVKNDKSDYIKKLKILTFDANRKLLAPLRSARQADWARLQPKKLNRRRYRLWFKKSVKREIYFSNYNNIQFILYQFFNRYISWEQVNILSQTCLLIVNGNYFEGERLRYGDLLETSNSLIDGMLAAWNKNFTIKYYYKIKRWSYLSYLNATNKTKPLRKKFPKVVVKLPIPFLAIARNFIVDYATNSGVYIYKAANTQISNHKLYLSSVYKLHTWRFRP